MSMQLSITRQQVIACGLVAIINILPACVRRTVYVTSDPAGASVTVNDLQVGRTPCEFDFTYHGIYDVSFTKPGFEPLRKPMATDVPIEEYPPIDLAALAWPGGVHTKHRWHVKLEASQEARITDDTARGLFEQSLLDRARAARSINLGSSVNVGK